MAKKEALASLTARGEGTGDAASEAARDIDWKKVRRVQHGLYRPHEAPGLRCGFLSREELEIAEARSVRAMRLANALALVAGVLLGVSLLRGLAAGPLLLASSLCFASAGVLMTVKANS